MPATPKPRHALKLTRGAVQAISEIAAIPGLLTDINISCRVNEFTDYIAPDLGPQPKLKKDATQWDAEAYVEAVKKWRLVELDPIEISEKIRDALKELMTAAQKAGKLSAERHTSLVMRALGLAPAMGE